MPEWNLQETPAAAANGTSLTAEQELAAERQMNELLVESYADLEALYRDDLGWQRIGTEKTRFSSDGRKVIAELADLFATGNALIKRGINLRISYVWGRGVDVSVLDDGAEGQDYPSPPITVGSAGTYYWVASYGSDPNNAASSTVCGDVNETPLVIKPHIAISKSPDAQTILIGQTANFTIQVTNDGDSTLTNVVVTDALAPGCARTSADIPGLASMAPGSTITYTCTLANVTANFTNSATATGTPPSGPNVSATDTAPVTVTAPARS